MDFFASFMSTKVPSINKVYRSREPDEFDQRRLSSFLNAQSILKTEGFYLDPFKLDTMEHRLRNPKARSKKKGKHHRKVRHNEDSYL